jgi:C1A family cysteine protease
MPPEDYWPYDENRLSEEPTPFCYAFADAFKAAKYYRLDGVDVTKKALLEKIRSHLAAELPVIFGFTTFGSMDHPDNQPGYIPFPDPSEKSKEGHAVMAVGYDDKKEIINPLNHKKTTGALLIKNSWGIAWGDKGYGWLPYDYVLKELAMDWWCIIREDWVDSNKFNQ